MDKFTDEDLKRIKEEIKGQPKSTFVSWFEVQDMQALLARLEAAEKVCEMIGSDSWDYHLMQAWKASAGR